MRFAMAWRGYRMSDVDWALERMANELDAVRAQLAERTPVAVGVARTIWPSGGPGPARPRYRPAPDPRGTELPPDPGDRE